MGPKAKKALFLDRDGVINVDSHYPYRPGHVRFRDGIFELCREAQRLGYLLIVVTNQAGVAKGKFTEDDVRALHAWMKKRFAEEGIILAAFYYCPHHEEGTVVEYARPCDCRKPAPGMFLRAAADHDIDLSRSVMVGDKVSDRISLPQLRSIIVKSEYTGDDGFDVETLDDVRGMLSPR